MPPHQTKVERIGDHVAALSADLREYVELRIALVQAKGGGRRRTSEGGSSSISTREYFVPAGFLGIIGIVFVFITLALGIGALVGSAWLGC